MDSFKRKFLVTCASLFLSLCCGHIEVSAEQEASTPKPAIQLSFSKQMIRENDRIEVYVWLANEGDQELTSLSLHVAGPSFLKWHADNCSGELFQQMRQLGPIPANNIKSFDLCIESDSTIVMGDFNILFVFEYTWQKAGKSGRAFVMAEKPLKVNLLGSDTVAGVPLVLAGYIIPGLFFWLVLSFYWKPPWSVELALGEKMIYSILVSVGIIVFAGLISNGAAILGFERVRNLIDHFDVTTGISIMRLLVLASAGLLLGMVVGKIDASLREYKKQKLRITDANDIHTMIEKLLLLNPEYTALVKWQPEYRPRTTIQFKSGAQYLCSLYAKSEDAVWLFGWFEIALGPQQPDVISKLKEYDAAGDLLGLVRFARKNKINIAGVNLIDQVVNANVNPTGQEKMEISNDEIERSTRDDNGKGKLITLR
jgi:hypothetical protein